MLAVELLRFQECGVEKASEALVGLDANDSRFHSLTFISTPAVCRNTNKQCEMKELRAGLFVRGPGKPITYACAEDACFSEALRVKPDLGIQKLSWLQRSRLGKL